jgi:hypothetical protein
LPDREATMIFLHSSLVEVAGWPALGVPDAVARDVSNVLFWRDCHKWRWSPGRTMPGSKTFPTMDTLVRVSSCFAPTNYLGTWVRGMLS